MIYNVGVEHEKEQNSSEQVLELAIAEQLSGKKDVKEEIDDWVQQSIRRIRALGPKRIMEVGCGAGQLLFELAPASTLYIGTDYSATAIENLRKNWHWMRQMAECENRRRQCRRFQRGSGRFARSGADSQRGPVFSGYYLFTASD